MSVEPPSLKRVPAPLPPPPTHTPLSDIPVTFTPNQRILRRRTTGRSLATSTQCVQTPTTQRSARVPPAPSQPKSRHSRPPNTHRRQKLSPARLRPRREPPASTTPPHGTLTGSTAVPARSHVLLTRRLARGDAPNAAATLSAGSWLGGPRPPLASEPCARSS